LTFGAVGVSGLVVEIQENGSVISSADTGAAQWVSPSAFVASSIETDRDLWLVVATWDLTDIERAATAARLNG
jgi:hypothetical protein